MGGRTSYRCSKTSLSRWIDWSGHCPSYRDKSGELFLPRIGQYSQDPTGCDCRLDLVTVNFVFIDHICCRNCDCRSDRPPNSIMDRQSYIYRDLYSVPQSPAKYCLYYLRPRLNPEYATSDLYTRTGCTQMAKSDEYGPFRTDINQVCIRLPYYISKNLYEYVKVAGIIYP